MAKKQLNKSLVLVLSVLAAVVIIALSVVMLKRLEPKDPTHFVELAEQSRAQQEWQTAAIYYHKAWENSGDAAYLVDAGQVWLDKGDLASTLRSWQDALVAQPDLIDAHRRRLDLLFELSSLYGNLQDWRSVREGAEALIDLDTEKKTPADLAFAHHALGMAFARLESQDDSYTARVLPELEQAVELAPEAVDFAVDLAVEYIHRGQTELGVAKLRGLMESHTAPGADASNLHLTYARHLAGSGKVEEAEAHFQRSIQLAVDDPDALRAARLGYVSYLSQRWAVALGADPASQNAQSLFDQAEAILNESIVAEPEDFDAPVQLALLYRAVERHADALAVCEARLARGFSREGVKGTRNRLRTFDMSIFASQACVALSLEAQSAEERSPWLQKAWQYPRRRARRVP